MTKTITELYEIAKWADDVLDNEILANFGRKVSRWDIDMSSPLTPGAVRAAYLAKVKADEEHHQAWEASRRI